MQDVHILCSFEQLQSAVAAFEEQFEKQKEEVVILDFGCSYKQERGYIVIEWDDGVGPTFIEQLNVDSDVLDFSIFTVSCITDDRLSALEIF